MNTRFFKILIIFVLVFSITGCNSQKKSKKNKISELPAEEQFNKTIGDLAEIMAYNPIPVKGIGLVVGLSGTGSSECPPAIRDYLRQYILTQVGEKQTISPDALINSKNTAVVLVEGLIPPAAFPQESFDIRIQALPNTQTTSLEGGRLYTTDLKLVSKIEDAVTSSKTLALAAGAVYIDNIADSKPNPQIGYVLGGGKALEEHQIMLAIINPDFRTAAVIRDRINARFDRDTANAASESMIYLNLPRKFKDRKVRFIELVKSLYIGSSPQSDIDHINGLVNQLKSAKSPADKEKAETGLEAVGKPISAKLLPLLDSSDELTKFVAARCLFNIGQDSALNDLRNFAQDSASRYRIAAIKAIGDAAAPSDVITIMNRLVQDKDFNTRYTAYKYLVKYRDSSIVQTAVAKDFYIDQSIQMSPKTVYVSRRDEPRIVLFGAPIECEKNVFIESDDGDIIINALPEESRISIMRKHPITGELMGPLKSGYKLADLIKLLGSEPAPENDKERVGLGVSYSQIAELLKKMCENGAVKAEFVAGPLTSMAQLPVQKPQQVRKPQVLQLKPQLQEKTSKPQKKKSKPVNKSDNKQ